MSDTNDPLGINSTKEEQKKIVENRDALSVNHIPDEIKYREEKITQIVNNTFKPALQGDEGEGNMVTGKAGTGKTAAVKYVINQVEDNYDTSDLVIAYVNCKNNSSQKEVFKSILTSCGLDYMKGKSIAENKKKLLKNFNKKDDEQLVVVLDEVDELYKGRREYINDILYTLSRPSEVSQQIDWNGNLTTTCVSNDKNINDYIRDDVRGSSYTPQSTEFLPYTVEEITEILSERQKEAYKEELLSESRLKEIAEEVKESFESDIRIGILILRKIPNKVDSKEGIVENYEDIVSDTIREVKKSRIEEGLNGKDGRFLIAVSSMLQNSKNDTAKLSKIVDGYKEGCKKAGIEKIEGEDDGKGRDDKSRSFVRRKMEYLVQEDILHKEKRYDKRRNPYFYTPKVDTEIFEQLVNERLVREGIKDRMEDIISVKEQQAKKEAQEKMEEMGAI